MPAATWSTAAWRCREGKVFVGTIDGRLVALDAATGAELWGTVTVDQDEPYTITGAPRVVRGKVIIGNSGAELGVRGYVSAYDAESGELAWRFYTVPGNPADGPDGAASDEAFGVRAADLERQLVGDGRRRHRVGLDRLRSRVRPAADRRRQRLARGTTARARPARATTCSCRSILALDPDTGAYKWHYQTKPGENWD